MNTQQIQELETDRIFAEGIVDTIREPLIVLDEDLTVVSVNRSFLKQFQVEYSQTVGKQIYHLGNDQWNIPELRELLERIIPENEIFEEFQVEHDFPDIGHRIMLLNAQRLELEDDHRTLILLAIEDVTESLETRRTLEASETLYHRLVETINSIIIEINIRGEITFFNSFSERLFGYSREELTGKKLVGTILPERDSQGTNNTELVAGLLQDPDRFYFNESIGSRKDGKEIWFSWSARKLKHPERNEAIILIDGR